MNKIERNSMKLKKYFNIKVDYKGSNKYWDVYNGKFENDLEGFVKVESSMYDVVNTKFGLKVLIRNAKAIKAKMTGQNVDKNDLLWIDAWKCINLDDSIMIKIYGEKQRSFFESCDLFEKIAKGEKVRIYKKNSFVNEGMI